MMKLHAKLEIYRSGWRNHQISRNRNYPTTDEEKYEGGGILPTFRGKFSFNNNNFNIVEILL